MSLALNVPEFWIFLGFEYASGFEYARILNDTRVLNMLGLHRIENMRENFGGWGP